MDALPAVILSPSISADEPAAMLKSPPSLAPLIVRVPEPGPWITTSPPVLSTVRAPLANVIDPDRVEVKVTVSVSPVEFAATSAAFISYRRVPLFPLSSGLVTT
jgi:hypothetical protein